MQTLWQDLAFALRIIRKNPAFTAVAIAVIALGSGAVSTIFSVANRLVLQSVPGVERSSELASIDRVRGDGGGSLSASYPYYEQLATRSKAMSGIAAWSMVNLTVSTGGEGAALLGNIVSGNYFDVLGVRPAIGRFFSAEESKVPNGYPVLVLSNAFWKGRFAGDSTIVGRSILVNGASYTVIGVAPARFSGVYPMLRTDAWVPLMMTAQLRPGANLASAGSAWLEMFGRVAPGVSRQAATAELTALTKQTAADVDGAKLAYIRTFTSARLTRVSGLPSDVAGAVLGFFVVLLLLSCVVLLIASVNVAGMLLARSVARRREIAVRVALGASRARLVRQLLTEGMVLFLLGGGTGTLLAVYGTRVLAQINLPVDVPLALDISPDARVLGFTLAVALITGIVSSIAPALQSTRPDIAGVLRAGGSGAGRGRSRLRNALVVGQVAMSLLLLTASGLFIRALDRGRRVDVGFDASNVATAAVDVGTAGYNDERARGFYPELAARLAALPGVTAVGFARILPLSMNNMGTDISIPGYAPPRGTPGSAFNVSENVVDGGYFAATRTPILRGRTFTASDAAHSAMVAMVNESFSKEFWPRGDAIGQTLKIDSAQVTIVGVTRDSKSIRLDERPSPFLYLPLAQHWRSETNVLVRTSGDPAAITAAITRTMHEIDPILPAPTYTTLQKSIGVVLLPQRFAVAVTGMLGVLGLVLAVVGLYGVLSFSMTQRTREIGVRVALGAVRRDVVGLVVAEGMTLVGIGIGAGLVLSLAVGQALRSFLFGVSPADPVTLVGTSLLLAATAMIACLVPARRAAGTDPMVALRAE